MTVAKKTRKLKAAIISTSNLSPAPQIELKAFYHGGGQQPGFGFARHYWASPGVPRESLEPKVLKKRRPAGAESVEDTAAYVEPLVPRDAPQDYAEADFLIRRYQEKLPAHETTAYAQVTLRFGPDIPNLHHPWEVARAWLRTFYVDGAPGIPVLAILHAPHLAGSENAVHVHGILLPRQLNKFGWGSMVRDLTTDAGHRKAFASWEAFKGERL